MDKISKLQESVDSMAYYDGKYKPIDIMLQQFGVEHIKSWCLLNAFKYLWRCLKKHETPIEDIKKAQYYINKYIELSNGNNKDRK